MTHDAPEVATRWVHHDGPVSTPLAGSRRELLEELCGVVEAVQEKDHALTRTGIPPKPLWNAINERLHWKDPESLLHDWDECDQVRLLYSLADTLRLIEKDEEGILRVGAGADQFFTAAPIVRGRMLMRAWIELVDWDERCDARDGEGYRHNFGRFFRRDFLRSPDELRRTLIACLSAAPDDAWVTGRSLAVLLTEADSALLIPEDHPAPIVRPGRADPEIARLADYLLFLAVRFGWVSLARIADDTLDGPDARIFRLTDFGRFVLRADAAEDEPLPERRPFILDASRDITVLRHEADFGDEYLVRRVAEATPTSWAEPAVTYRLSAASVGRALENGLDPALIDRRVLQRARTPVPDTLSVLFADALRARGACSIVRGLTAIELPAPVMVSVRDALEAAGLHVVSPTLVLVPWHAWDALCDALGDEPREGFRYPAEEPLARVNGDAFQLEWAGLPIAARDLLDALELDGERDCATLDAETLARLENSGWPRAAVALALVALTGGLLPRLLKG